MEQLTDSFKSHFPSVMTCKYACDNTIVSMMTMRTQGNSSTAQRNKIKELRSDDWLSRNLRYMSDCNHHKQGLIGLRMTWPKYELPPAFPAFPNALLVFGCLEPVAQSSSSSNINVWVDLKNQLYEKILQEVVWRISKNCQLGNECRQ